MRPALAIARAAGVLFLSAAGTAAALSGARPDPAAVDGPLLGRSGGAMALDDSRAGTAILGGSNLAPGDSVSGDVALTTEGDGRSQVSLLLSDLVENLGPQGGRLSSVLQLRVVEEDAGGQRRTRYAGLLKNLGIQELPPYGPGETRTYHFTAT